MAVGFSTVVASADDVIVIESVTKTKLPCLNTRYTDGRPWGSTTVKGPAAKSKLEGHVVFDAATSPLPAGEYVARLQSSSVGIEMAVTYFTVIPAYRERSAPPPSP